MYSTLLLAAASVPATVEWSPKVAIVMIICNIIAIAFGKITIKNPNEGPGLPSPEFFGGMGFPRITSYHQLGSHYRSRCHLRIGKFRRSLNQEIFGSPRRPSVQAIYQLDDQFCG